MYPNPNLDLWPFNSKTMSLLGYPKIIPCTKFEHFGIIRFWVKLRLLVWKTLTVTLTRPLTFDFSTPKNASSRISQGQFLYQVWLWDHSFFSYAADKQTNRQTDKQTDRQTASNADIAGVGNYVSPF